MPASRSLPGSRRLRIAMVGVALAALAVTPLALHWLTNPADQRLVDLDVYRTAGTSVLTGRPVYEVLTQAPQLLPFTYPPIAAILAIPLAFVPWPVTQWLWVAAIFVVLAISVRYAFAPLLDRLGDRAPLALAVLVAATAYLLPVADQVRFGQVDIFLVALCLVDCVARQGRLPRGVLVGVATAVKLTPGVFVIYFWLTGRRREAMVATVTAAALTLGAFLLIPADSADFWLRALADTERLGANRGTSNQSLRGMLTRVVPEPLDTLLWLAAVAIVGYLGFRTARRVWAQGDEISGVAVVGLLAVLLSPVAWIHHLAWVVVALGAIVSDGRDRLRWLVAGVVWLYFLLPIPWYGASLLGAGERVIGRIVQDGFGLAALVLIWVLGVWLPGRPQRSGPETGEVARATARAFR